MGKEILFLRSLYEYAKRQIPEKKILVQRINRVKNELKHNDVGENSWVEADFEFEATELYIKAIKNYFNVYKGMPKDRTIMGLFEFLTL